MKTLLLLLSLATTSAMTFSQTISGVVQDKSEQPLLGVNVYVQGTYDGATTDIDGGFSFQTDALSDAILIVSYIGFKTQEIPLMSVSQPIVVTMREEINQLDAVVISAGSFNASDENNREVLKPLDVVTTAGTTADVPGALNTLPGTQRVGETGRLFVRGGEGRETKTFIDGMLVHNEYSPTAPNTPSRSRFSPFMFKGTSFSTGGYSAEYGQALSSALILNSKDVAGSNRTDISLMTVGTDVSTTRSFENSSLAGKVQYTNLTPYFSLVSQNLSWDKAPQDINGNFAYRVKTGKSGMLKLYTNLSTSRMELYEAEIHDPEVKVPVEVANDYAYFNANYRDFVTKEIGLRTGVSITKSHDFAARNMASRTRDILGFHTKVVADYQHSDRLFVLAGGEVIGQNLDQELNDGEAFVQGINERMAASFLEVELFASNALAFKAGMRGEYSNLRGDFNFDPRISAAYKTGESSQVSVAYGSFRQLTADQVLLNNESAAQEVAQHYIANYQWVKDGQTFRIEVYDKEYHDLTRFENVFDPTTYQFNGSGYARGIDLFWRDNKTVKNMDYWVSYSFLDTKRDYQDFPGSFTPAFASAHNFSVVTKKFIDEIRSQVGVTYSYASPRSYHDLNSDEFMSGRTPSYHDLSFNISYLYSSQIIIHAMVNNVLGINNIFGYEYANEPNDNGIYASRAITPPAKRFIFLGVFITLSKNKGINQLPNL